MKTIIWIIFMFFLLVIFTNIIVYIISIIFPPISHSRSYHREKVFYSYPIPNWLKITMSWAGRAVSACFFLIFALMIISIVLYAIGAFFGGQSFIDYFSLGSR